MIREYVTDEIPDGFFDQPQKDTIEILRELKNKIIPKLRKVDLYKLLRRNKEK